MRKILSFFSLLCCIVATSYANDLTGKVLTQAKSTTDIVAGQWYTMTNNGYFLSDDGSSSLTTNTRAALNWATDVADMMVKFEKADDGYYIHTANGYVGEPGTSDVPVTAEPTAVYAITHDGNGAYTLSNNSKALAISGGKVTGTDKASAWSLYAVSLKSQAELTDAQNKTFITKQLEKEKGILARLRNKREGNKYLCASGDKFQEKVLTNKQDMNYIWVIKPNGSGYEFLNAKTSTFLGKDYDVPGVTATTLYIQFSPNSTETYWNISSKADFEGGSCLNGNGENLYEWGYAGDAGCDWALEMVYETSIDEVIDDVLGKSPYAKAPEEGVFYRLINGKEGLALTQDDDRMFCLEKNNSLFGQYWTMEKSGNGWAIKNVLTDEYINQQPNISNLYPLSSETNTMYIIRTDNDWAYDWYITDSPDANAGMHCAGGKEVVRWYNDSPSNVWSLEEVSLTEEEIAAAKKKENEYSNLVADMAKLQTALDGIFTDKGATTLNDTYAAMADEQLMADEKFNMLNDELKAMVMKIKNDTWAYKSGSRTEAVPDGNYERFFRINSYMPHSHHQKMAEEMGQSNAFGRLSGPTGIALKAGEVAYIFLNEDVPAGTTVQVEAVNVVPYDCGTGSTGQATDLKKGLNLLRYTQDKMLFIFYEVNDVRQSLAKFPDLNVHIEGGQVYGTFDLTRGMKNQDWDNMMALGLIQNFPIVNLKTEHLMMMMNREYAVQGINAGREKYGTDYTDIELMLHVWNTICDNEEHYQDLKNVYGDRYRNIWIACSVKEGMFASTYGTYYYNECIPEILDYYLLTHRPGIMWGMSHEMGHNHQRLINTVGSTEVSNNMFSNINDFESGCYATGGETPKTNFTNLADKMPWLARDIWVRTRMYFQLYLYFHAQGADPQFLQKLFAEFRKNPMTAEGQWKSKTVNGKNVSGQIVYGKNDYLKFAKKCCDITQTDLSEFFESYGFFVPVEDFFVDDYATYFVTTTQNEINEAKAYMKKYKKKAGNIMFINDFAVQNPADANNKFRIIPDASSLKSPRSNDANQAFGYQVNTGNYLLYNQTTDYQVTDDYYTATSTRITFKGKNFLGHKVYDLDGNLIWAVAKDKETIPTAIRSLFPDKVRVVAVDQNMEDIPCHYFKAGSSPVYDTEVTFPTGTTRVWPVNRNINAYLPANAVAVVIDESEANDEVLGSTNVVSKAGVAGQLVIDGNKAMVLPRDFTAEQLTFTKKGTGYQALQLPFDIHATTIVNNERVKNGPVAAGNPVVVEGDVNYTLSHVAVKAAIFLPKESGFALNTTGDAVEATTGLSAFTYNFDGPATITTATAINDIPSQPDAEATQVFDISGRRVGNVKKGGLYIINGKKTLVK